MIGSMPSCRGRTLTFIGCVGKNEPAEERGRGGVNEAGSKPGAVGEESRGKRQTCAVGRGRFGTGAVFVGRWVGALLSWGKEEGEWGQ